MIRLSGIAVVALVVIVGLAPLGEGVAGPSAPRTLTQAFGAIPTTGDPGFDTGAWAMDAYDAVFDTLVVFRDGRLQPSVAESWRALSDTEWEFRLRRDVRFHNGEPLNAAAVKFSLERIVNPANRIPWSSLVGPITRVDAVDDVTVRITTSRVVATLPQNLLVAYLVPPRYFQQVGPERFAREPIGSGPFRFKEMNPLTHFTVTAFPQSWRWGGRQPGLTEVTWKKIQEDATRVAAFRAGEVDVADSVPPELVARVRQSGNVVSVPIAQTLTINLRNTWDTPLKDKRVRQALNYAVDKETIVRTILQGHATMSEGQLIGRDAFGFNPAVRPYPFDQQRARQLLAEAGHPNGFEMTFHGSQGRYPKDKEVAEVIIAQLARVGVRARLEYLENAVFSAMSRDGTIGPLNIFGWQYMPAMDISQPIPFFRCDTPRKQFCDPVLDDGIDAMLGEVDPARRAQRAHTLAVLLRDTAPVIFLWQFHSIYGIKSYVRGYTPSAARRVDLVNVTVQR